MGICHNLGASRHSPPCTGARSVIYSAFAPKYSPPRREPAPDRPITPTRYRLMADKTSRRILTAQIASASDLQCCYLYRLLSTLSPLAPRFVLLFKLAGATQRPRIATFCVLSSSRIAMPDLTAAGANRRSALNVTAFQKPVALKQSRVRELQTPCVLHLRRCTHALQLVALQACACPLDVLDLKYLSRLTSESLTCAARASSPQSTACLSSASHE